MGFINTYEFTTIISKALKHDSDTQQKSCKTHEASGLVCYENVSNLEFYSLVSENPCSHSKNILITIFFMIA